MVQIFGHAQLTLHMPGNVCTIGQKTTPDLQSNSDAGMISAVKATLCTVKRFVNTKTVSSKFRVPVFALCSRTPQDSFIMPQ